MRVSVNTQPLVQATTQLTLDKQWAIDCRGASAAQREALETMLQDMGVLWNSGAKFKFSLMESIDQKILALFLSANKRLTCCRYEAYVKEELKAYRHNIYPIRDIVGEL